MVVQESRIRIPPAWTQEVLDRVWTPYKNRLKYDMVLHVLNTFVGLDREVKLKHGYQLAIRNLIKYFLSLPNTKRWSKRRVVQAAVRNTAPISNDILYEIRDFCFDAKMLNPIQAHYMDLKLPPDLQRYNRYNRDTVHLNYILFHRSDKTHRRGSYTHDLAKLEVNFGAMEGFKDFMFGSGPETCVNALGLQSTKECDKVMNSYIDRITHEIAITVEHELTHALEHQILRSVKPDDYPKEYDTSEEKRTSYYNSKVERNAQLNSTIGDFFSSYLLPTFGGKLPPRKALMLKVREYLDGDVSPFLTHLKKRSARRFKKYATAFWHGVQEEWERRQGLTKKRNPVRKREANETLQKQAVVDQLQGNQGQAVADPQMVNNAWDLGKSAAAKNNVDPSDPLYWTKVSNAARQTLGIFEEPQDKTGPESTMGFKPAPPQQQTQNPNKEPKPVFEGYKTFLETVGNGKEPVYGGGSKAEVAKQWIAKLRKDGRSDNEITNSLVNRMLFDFKTASDLVGLKPGKVEPQDPYAPVWPDQQTVNEASAYDKGGVLYQPGNPVADPKQRDPFEWELSSTKYLAKALILLKNRQFETRFEVLTNMTMKWPMEWRFLKPHGIVSVLRITVNQLQANPNGMTAASISNAIDPGLTDDLVKTLGKVFKSYLKIWKRSNYQIVVFSTDNGRNLPFVTKLGKELVKNSGFTLDPALQAEFCDPYVNLARTKGYYVVLKNSAGGGFKEDAENYHNIHDPYSKADPSSYRYPFSNRMPRGADLGEYKKAVENGWRVVIDADAGGETEGWFLHAFDGWADPRHGLKPGDDVVILDAHGNRLSGSLIRMATPLGEETTSAAFAATPENAANPYTRGKTGPEINADARRHLDQMKRGFSTQLESTLHEEDVESDMESPAGEQSGDDMNM